MHFKVVHVIKLWKQKEYEWLDFLIDFSCSVGSVALAILKRKTVFFFRFGPFLFSDWGGWARILFVDVAIKRASVRVA